MQLSVFYYNILTYHKGILLQPLKNQKKILATHVTCTPPIMQSNIFDYFREILSLYIETGKSFLVSLIQI